MNLNGETDLKEKVYRPNLSLMMFPSNTRIFSNLKTEIIFAIFSPNFFKPSRLKFLQIKAPNHKLEVLNLLTFLTKRYNIIILRKFDFKIKLLNVLKISYQKFKMIKMVRKFSHDLKTATKATLNFKTATDVTKASLNFQSATDVTKASLNQNHVSSMIYVFQTRIYLAMDVTKAFFINIAEQTIYDASFSTPFLENITHGQRDNQLFHTCEDKENPTFIIQNT
jgi:hypothetical protein